MALFLEFQSNSPDGSFTVDGYGFDAPAYTILK